jgi:hypothetical protein
MEEFSAEDRATITVALKSYAEWLTKQRNQAERDRRRLLRWAESERIGKQARASYVKQSEDIGRYMDARNARIDDVLSLVDRVSSEAVAA